MDHRSLFLVKMARSSLLTSPGLVRSLFPRLSLVLLSLPVSSLFLSLIVDFYSKSLTIYILNTGIPPRKGKFAPIDRSEFAEPEGSRKPRVVMLHSCGVHGVEGYAGSAIQLQAIGDKAFQAKLAALASDVAVVFIHAVNPFGMSHWRRWNESNVDLNRNLLADEMFPEYTENSLKTKASYDELKEIITPSVEPWSWKLNTAVMGGYYIYKYGYERLKKTLASGQYHTQNGLWYGGDKMEQSHRLLTAFLVENFGSAEHYVHVDIHTGLGTWAHDMIIIEDEKRTSTGFTEALGDHKVSSFGYNADGALPQGLLRVFFPQDSAKPYHHGWLGSLDNPENLQKRVSTTKSFEAVTQEFGTYPGIQVFDALRIENFYHQRHHDVNKKDYYYQWSKKNVLDTFFPVNDGWRSTVLQRGDWLLKRLFDYAASK